MSNKYFYLSDDKYQKIDLGVLPRDFFDMKIKVLNSYITIWINNKKVDMSNVTYLNSYLNYFKAGAYLQDTGCAKVWFDKLEAN